MTLLKSKDVGLAERRSGGRDFAPAAAAAVVA